MKFFKNLEFMLKFIWKHSKLWMLFTAIATVMNAVSPLVNVFLPKYMIDAVFEHKSLKEGLMWAGIIVFINLFIHYILG